MSLQALQTPIFPSTVLSRPLFTREPKEGKATSLESSSSSASTQRYQTVFAESAGQFSQALSDVQSSNCEGGEQNSTADCSLPYLLLSEALAGLPATFNTKASDKPRFYSYDAVNQQKEPTCFVAEKSDNLVEVSAKDLSTDTGCSAVAATRSCMQEALSSVPSSLNANFSSPSSCFPDSHASKVIDPFEEALATVQNYFNSEAQEINADNYVPSLDEKALKHDGDLKLKEADLFTTLVKSGGESVARERDEGVGVNVQNTDLVLSRQPDARATDQRDTCADLGTTVGNGAASAHVPKPEDLERIAYVIRGFGLPPGPSLPTAPPSGLQSSRDSEILSGHDLAHFIGRRHTLPAKGPLELTPSNEVNFPADRVVHRRHSGPFLLPVFSFCDSECGGLGSEHVTIPTQGVAPIQLGESPSSKPLPHSEQPRERAGDVETLRRNQIDSATTEQAKYTLIVNVPPTTTRQDLHLTFSAFGVVELTVVVCDKDHRHPNKEWTATSGYAFVRFSKTEEAAAAVAAAALGTVRLRGSRVRATWAKKDSVPKHASGGNAAAGYSRGTSGNGRGFSAVSEPGTPAQGFTFYERMQDRGTRDMQHHMGTILNAPDRERSGAASDLVQTYSFRVPLSLCLTPQSAQEFACHICRTNLAADPIVLPCWHLFCTECLQQWKNHTTTGRKIGYCCPNCGMWTATVHEKKMDEAAGGPLLKLRQIRDAETVACFYTPKCRWTGPVSCISTHMRLHTFCRNLT